MSDILFYVHPTAEVSPAAHIGVGTRIWRQAQVREYAYIGETCNIGKGVYIDAHVRIGSNVKIQNHVSIFEGVTLEDGIFIGPHVCFTNDLLPRAITPDGKLKSADDWEITPTLVKYGASIGAGAVIVWSHGMLLPTGLSLAIRHAFVAMSAAAHAASRMCKNSKAGS